MIKIHKYYEFVHDFKYIVKHVKELKIERNENKNKFYLNVYLLTKKQFDNIENCYKCHQSKHKINNKNVFCKHIL